MIIDTQVYLGDSLFDYGHSLPEILANMNRLNIDKAILIPVKPKDYHLAPINDQVSKAVLQNPDRFYGLCRVDPWQKGAAVVEAKRGFEELGACGLYLDPLEENFAITDDHIRSILETAEAYNKPVVVNAGHVRVSHIAQIRDMANRYPGVQWVVCNGGWINSSGMLYYEGRAMMDACPNVVISTSGVYREDFLEEIFKEVGEERVLFGSRSPIYDQEFEMVRIQLAHLTETQKEKLWSTNAMAVFS